MRALTLVLAALVCSVGNAHESCCARKARLAKLKFIADPNATAPDVDANGQPKMVDDPEDVKPAAWDDEDDGPWECSQMPNPLYSWEPPLVPNPDYKPPSFADEYKSEVLKALPWVTLGTIVTATLEAVQLPMHKLGTLLQRAGPLGGALIGLATPLCSCGALPVAASFVTAGTPLGAVVAFLTASQSAGLDSAAITWGLLGPSAALCRLAGALVLALAAGFAANSIGVAPLAGQAAATGKAVAAGNPLVTLLKAAVGSAADVYPMVLLGLGLSTAAAYWLPALEQTHGTLGGSALGGPEHWAQGLSARLLVLVSAMPLQLCEHTTVTLAAGIQRAGGPPGLAFAFLLSAPATNLPSLLLLLTAHRQLARDGGADGASSSRFLAARVALALAAAALLLSYAVDAAGIDLHVEQEAALGAGSMLPLPEWYVRGAPWVAGLLAAAALVHGLSKRVWPVADASKDECCADGGAICGATSSGSSKKVD